MKTILVTGSDGFIGKNLCARLRLDESIELLAFDRNNTKKQLESYIKRADFIFHLAGVNRPKDESEFDSGNRGFTEEIISLLEKNRKNTPVLITSSIQAGFDNPYGKSKIAAEEVIFNYKKKNKAQVYVYRLPNVFGKWCKPNYNSVVATFCSNIANGLSISINDSSTKLSLVYIDEVVASFIKALKGKEKPDKDGYCYIPRSYSLTLKQLADKLEAFRNSRDSLVVPDFQKNLDRYLYATYSSYLPEDKFSYSLNTNIDDRGWLAELIKSKQFGQMFVSKTKPGITRGNHWHHSKAEKFFVIDGEGEIKFRNINDKKNIISYKVSSEHLTVLDIPAGYIHSIKNIGEKDLITLFWAGELFNKDSPDTYFEEI